MDVRVEVLRRFVVLAEELSFTRAAARLHLSQQVLSAQTRALEAEVGARLLDRTSRRVTLTEAGRAFLPHAVAAVAAADTAVRAATGAGRPARLRLGCQVDAQWLLADAVQGLDPTEVEVTTLLAVDLPALAAAASPDAVVGWAPLPPALGEQQVTLAVEEVLVVLLEGDPLVLLDRVPVAALAPRTLWLWQPGVGRGDWDGLADHVDPARTNTATLVTGGSPAQEDMVAAVLDKGGCTLAPRSHLLRLRPAGVVGKPMDPPLHRPVVLAWTGRPAPALRLLLEAVAPRGARGGTRTLTPEGTGS